MRYSDKWLIVNVCCHPRINSTLIIKKKCYKKFQSTSRISPHRTMSMAPEWL